MMDLKGHQDRLDERLASILRDVKVYVAHKDTLGASYTDPFGVAFTTLMSTGVKALGSDVQDTHFTSPDEAVDEYVRHLMAEVAGMTVIFFRYPPTLEETDGRFSVYSRLTGYVFIRPVE